MQLAESQMSAQITSGIGKDRVNNSGDLSWTTRLRGNEMTNFGHDQTDSNTDYGLLIQSITDYAIYRLSPDGIVTTWNAGAERIKGYAASEVIGQHYSLFFTPEDRAGHWPQKALGIAAAAGRFDDEGWRVRKDGTRFWSSVVIDPIWDSNGQLVGYAKVTRDLTENRTAQEALRKSERRLRLLLESVVHYAIFTIDLQGLVTSWNPGAERTKGYARSEILGRSFSQFYTPDDQAAGKPAKALETARTTGRYEEEGWRVRKDGSQFWASVVIEPMADEAGQPIGFTKITRDITERRSLEEARDQLHRAQKMETVGQLTGGVAHDFNNLLAIVMGSLELIAAANDHDKIRRLVTTAQRAAQRGAELTSRLLAFARKQILLPEVSDVNILVGNFEALLKQAGTEATQLQLNLSPDLWLSNIDQAQFLAALLNLVVNARDAMPSGGALTIETRNVFVDPITAAQLTEIAPGPYVRIVVRDTGEGMAPEVRARAIEPFYTTKDVGRGSGLGLSQVYGFVRQSNGQIQITSEVGEGTTVTIYLPRSNLGKSGAADITKQPNDDDHKTILAVEDDPDVLEIAVEAIRSFGYSVYPARDATEALSILQHDLSVDVLFTDVILPPGINGVELAQNALRLRPSLRVLLASGYPRDALATQDVFARTNMAFIRKPYKLSALNAQLESLVRGTPN